MDSHSGEPCIDGGHAKGFCSAYPRPSRRCLPDLIHEVKYDGYRLRVERNGDRVRLLSKGGLDWTKRYPWIVQTARKIRKKQFILDGEAVVLGVEGISDINALHSRQNDEEVQLYAFDILAYDGDDLMRLPLHLRKTNLEQLLRGRPHGIFVAPFERGKLGPDLFEAACKFQLEGIVSKHRERPYRAGRCDHWLKVKNRNHQRSAASWISSDAEDPNLHWHRQREPRAARDRAFRQLPGLRRPCRHARRPGPGDGSHARPRDTRLERQTRSRPAIDIRPTAIIVFPPIRACCLPTLPDHNLSRLRDFAGAAMAIVATVF
jgi:bifunctional non-homologous end joining protein LigD